MSSDGQTAAAAAASPNDAVATPSSVASAAAALAAASSASAASPKEERKVGKLNMAAFSNAGSSSDAAGGAGAAAGGKPVGKLGVKMQIPLFSPSNKGPAGPGGNQTLPAKRVSLNIGDSSASAEGEAGAPNGQQQFGTGGGPGSMRGMGTAPGKLQANSLMSNLNAMLVGGPRRARSGSISGEDAIAQGQTMPTVADGAEENGASEPAPTITHAKRARVNRKARTKPTELAKAGITAGFKEVEMSKEKVAAITLVSVAPPAATAQPQEPAVTDATTSESNEADSSAAAAPAAAVPAAAASPSKPSPPNYPKPPPPRQLKPIEEAQAAPAVPAAAAAATESVEAAPASASSSSVPSADSSHDASSAAPIAAAVPSSSDSSSSSSSSLPAPPSDPAQSAAWSAASLYGDFEEQGFDESKADEYRLLAAAGAEFLKHGRSGKPAKRLVFVTSSLMLLWTEPGKRNKPDPKSSINLALASIPKIAVVKGKTTPNFQRSTAAKVDPKLCLSVTAPRDKNLDIEARSEEERDAWYAAFKFLLNEAQVAREKALVYGAMH